MRIVHILIIVLTLCCAFFLGWVLSAAWQEPLPLRFIHDDRPAVCTVALESWLNGRLRGVVRGSGRLIVGNRSVVPNASGAFAITLATVRPPIVATSAGEAQPRFVASKRGTKYYPVGSKAGEKLSPKNRIYFATSEEAEKAGYTSGK